MKTTLFLEVLATFLAIAGIVFSVVFLYQVTVELEFNLRLFSSAWISGALAFLCLKLAEWVDE